MSYSFGAFARGAAGATVEHHGDLYLLASARGALATPALESIKAAFFRVAAADEAAATAVCAAAPSMIADAVAIVLIANGRAYIACSGDGCVLRQREGAATAVTGAQPLQAGDDLIASATRLGVRGSFFDAPCAPAPPQFRNDTLDPEIAAAGVIATTGLLAIAAVRSA